MPIRFSSASSTNHRRRRTASFAVVAALATSLAGLAALDAPAQAQTQAQSNQAAQTQVAGRASVDFGANVFVFDPSMPTAQIQATADRIANAQVDNEMGPERYSLLFKPGSYGTAEQPLQIRIGYGTEVAGLGENPGDVRIIGKIETYNRCLDDGGTSNCIALNNFWRSMSNLTIEVNGTGQDGCRQSANFWAVSQASSMRRVKVEGGNLSLMDYCTAGPQFASGGFIADSSAGTVISGSQQQWLTRNSTVGEWSNGVWNQVFAGVEGAPADTGFPTPPYTTLDRTPVSREKPWLFVDSAGAWQVRVPAAADNSRGTTWSSGSTPGRTVPLSKFFVARPSDSPGRINAALASGKNLLLTPGVYDVSRSLRIQRADTVVLGMGMAVLTSQRGATPLQIADRPGIVVAGVTVDAGPTKSRALAQVGASKSPHGRPAARSNSANPLTLSDVYFRVGGPHEGSTDVALRIDADHVLVDHTWVWRADHGVEDFTGGFLGDDERWATNVSPNGVIVNGDDVTATGLFVEHFQKHNTIWNGERGRTVFYQNELPYDPPTQADWTQPNGTLGYAGYAVAKHVKVHELWGGGSYVYNRNNDSIVTENGFQAPTTPGVKLHHLLTVNLGAGTTRHVVNGIGSQVDNSNTGTPAYVAEFGG